MPDRPRPPTSADVAKRASVSRTTVSFVLNERPGTKISAGTRARVFAAARELGYEPHPGARHLASGRTFMVSLVLRQTPDQLAGDPFLAESVRGVSQGLSAFGYRLLIDTVSPNSGSIRDLVRTRHLDGIVLSGPMFHEAEIDHLVEERFPIVVQGSAPDSLVTSVDVDNVAGARAAVAHLIGTGRRRIACVTNAPLDYAVARQRLEGYRSALAEAEIEYEDGLVAFGAFDAPSGHRAIDEIIDRGIGFDAVFAASDVVAIGVIGRLAAIGRQIPDVVAVVGFDDIPVAAYLDPPLTTVRVPAFELGLSTGRLLLDVIAGRPVPRRTLLPTELIVRESTRMDGRDISGGPSP